MENECEVLIDLLKTAKYGTHKHALEDAQTPDAIADIADSLLARGVTIRTDSVHAEDAELMQVLQVYAEYDCNTCSKLKSEQCEGLDCKVMLAKRALTLINDVRTEANAKTDAVLRQVSGFVESLRETDVSGNVGFQYVEPFAQKHIT